MSETPQVEEEAEEVLPWPGNALEECEKVTEETIAEDAFQRDVFTIERKEGGRLFHLKLVADVEVSDEVWNAEKEDNLTPEKLATMLLNRIMMDLNMSVLPVMVHKLGRHLRDH